MNGKELRYKNIVHATRAISITGVPISTIATNFNEASSIDRLLNIIPQAPFGQYSTIQATRGTYKHNPAAQQAPPAPLGN